MGVAVRQGRGVAVGSAVLVTVGESGAVDVKITAPVSVEAGKGVTVTSEIFVAVGDKMETGVDVNEICVDEGFGGARGVGIGVVACGVPFERKMKKRINKRIATINLKRS